MDIENYTNIGVTAKKKFNSHVREKTYEVELGE